MRILICDDNQDAADLFAMMLRSHGHEVRVHYDGLRCLQDALEWTPAAAFLDIGMPHINGYGVARKLREAFGTNILLVAVTAWGDPEHRAEALTAGFDFYLTKPADMRQLLAIAGTRSA